MTCSRNFRRVLQAGCLGLIGALTIVGCGGSESKPDTGTGGTGGIDAGPTSKPNISAAPATVDRGSVDVGTTSTPATVKITNAGDPGTVTVTPTGVGISAVGCGGTLAKNGNCTVTITAAPTAVGAIVGSITVSAAGGNSVSIGVTGTATQPGVFTLAPGSINLGDVAAGTPVSTFITVTSSIALTGLTTGVQGADLKIDTAASTCTPALAANTPCKVAVIFNAATAGAPVGDAIVVTQNGTTKSVPVTANVLAPAKLAATPTSGALATAPGTTSSGLDISVGNIGGMTTGQLTVALSGANAADFTLLSDKCSIVTLAGGGGAACVVTVAYKPAATVVAAEAATLTIKDSGTAASSVAVALSGTPNISGLKLAGAPALGSVAPGSMGTEVAFTVTNTAATPTGALTASVSSALVTISSNTCATVATLNKGDTCAIGLKLAPAVGTAAQAISGLLTVDTVSAGSASASFTGTVVTPSMLVALPTSVSFGSIPINQQSTAQAVVVTNAGATATGTLAVTLSGPGAAQVAITANTCTGTLAPAATCTFSVQFTPTDTNGVNGNITVSDGIATLAVPMVGTGLVPSTIKVSGGNPLDFLGVVLGSKAGPKTLTVAAVDLATTTVGVVTASIAGAAAADFAIKTDTSTCATIQPGPGQSCTFDVTFAPSALGARPATLTLTTSKGGTYQVVLAGTGLAVVEILPSPAPTAPATGLDFGQVPVNSTAAAPTHDYMVVVRGPIGTAAAPLPTTVTVGLTDTAAPTNFSYPAGVVTNPCTGAILDLASALPPVGAWTHVSTPGIQGYTCTFTVQFKPQSTKGDKTATITASGSAGGTPATLTLTGTATGPLKFSPSPASFGTTAVAVGDSTNQLPTTSNVTVTLSNTSTTVVQGPISGVALSGANAGEFLIVQDTCSFTSLTVSAGTRPSCTIEIAFVPTSVGAKTAVLTANAGSGATLETATVTLTALGGPAFPVQVNGSLTPAAVDFGTIVQTQTSPWVAFTVTNPAAATTSAQIGYAITTPSDYVLADNSASAPYGTCGASGTTQLAPGGSCTILAQFRPTATDTLNLNIGATLTVDGGSGAIPVTLKGKASSQLAITPATHDFGSVGQGSPSTPFTLTVTNSGAAAATVVLNNAALAPYQFDTTTCLAGPVAANGGTCTVVATYVGNDTVGTTPASKILTATIAASTATASAQLDGKTVAPAALVAVGLNSPTTINLGGVRKGETSGNVTLLFQNTGSVATSALNYTWAGAAANTADTQFTIVTEATTGCVGKASLAPLQTCTVTINFTPLSDSLEGTAVPKVFTLSAIQGGSVAIFTLTATPLSNTTGAWYANSAGTRAFYAFPGTTLGVTPLPSPLTGPSQVFTFTAGTAAVNVSAVLAITPSTDFVVDGTKGSAPCNNITGTPPQVGVGGNCTFAVTFQPTPWTATTGSRVATIGTGATTLGLFGTVQSPAHLTITTPADFGQVVAGTTSAAQNFTVTNDGQTASGAVTITTGGTDAALFIVGGACTAALAPGATCVGTVAVAPGTKLAGIAGNITATAGAVSSATVPLTATGVFDTTLSPSPLSLTFAATAVGMNSAAQTVTVSNAASARTSGPLTAAVTDAVNFTVTGGTCNSNAALPTPVGVAAGGSCTVIVQFNPQTLGTGTFTTNLTITGTPGGTKTVPITATAVSALTFAAATAVQGTVGPVTYVATLVGSGQTSYITTSMSGTSYFIADDGCVATKLGGSLPMTCSIKVEFVATSATPTTTGTLTVNGGPGMTATLVISSQ